MASTMKLIFCVCLLFLIGCSEQNRKANNNRKKVIPDLSVSRAQSWIQFLVDNYKNDYDTATTENSRDSIGSLYYNKIYDFLANHYIDSIKVHVDTVLVSKRKIVTSFHCTPEIVFRSELGFPFPRDKKSDTLYNFMKGLKVGSDTMINFCYFGNHELYAPIKNMTVLKIFAFPCQQLLPRE